MLLPTTTVLLFVVGFSEIIVFPTGAAFYVTKEEVSVRNTLNALGHIQGSTPIEYKNQCATGIMKDTIKQKQSKEMDIQLYWLRSRVPQGQLIIYW